MHIRVLAAVAGFAGISWAAPGYPAAPNRGPGSQSTSTLCYTKMATTPAVWRTTTSWTTHYTPCTSTTTVTVTKTSTPSQGTSTSTVVTTTTSIGPTVTDTASSTLTVTNTQSTTTTSTVSTTTTTTTTSSVASTVPAPVAFIPVQTSLPGSSYTGSGGSSPVSKKRDLVHEALVPKSNVEPSAQIPPHGPGISPNQQRIPQGVTCQMWQPSPRCSVSTATTTTTVTGPTPPPTTTTVTSTVTVTSTPGATTTVISTTTTTTTSTETDVTTSTSTETDTVFSTTTTVYAACATNNFADQYDSQGIGNVIPYGVGGAYAAYDTLEGVDAYQCCVGALHSTDQIFIWAWFPDNSCIMGGNPPGGVCSQATGETSVVTGGDLVVGNGPCGEVLPPP
ncbi:uncharacterized protein PV07_03635 [Cladophialophora immunda]|uniref:Ig-like domain-containing protein n=1 Tax=Cladophialophora immunda TaxID=569365 RepID=A0A0D1ZVC1_9EURO|nr:uncharacterized protein PV07_03635 [Cladophialophora immunda]KIW32061.1 hypothetical protein PV07_03635 [Cladophialophora immunda]